MEDKLFGFNIYKHWYSQFPFTDPFTDDYPRQLEEGAELRIDELSKRINLEGKSILELGSLEGAHSLILHSLGIKKIIGIEGRSESFLKCLIVKNAFNLNKCKFLFGDVSKVLPVLTGYFDVCLALGVLYHLEDPISLIYRIAELTDNLFAWTHYSTDDYPEGHLIELKYKGGICRGKYVRENSKDSFSGLGENSFWIFEDDLFKVLNDAGFKNIDLIHKGEYEHGPGMLFLAKNNAQKSKRYC